MVVAPAVTSSSSSSSPERIAYASVAGSLAMVVALVGVYVVFASQLALAQAADSISDVVGGAVLAWAVREAAQPADDEHPLGHARAEPLAALLVAVLTSLLAFEVLRTAASALVTGAHPILEWPVAVAFVAKAAFKSVIVAVATREVGRGRANAALRALRIDARNDVLLCSVAIVGFGAARWGHPAADAWLALPIAIYVAISGIRLARENIGLVMSAAAPPETTERLTRAAAEVARVVSVDKLIATWAGSSLHVQVEIAVAGETPLHDAHEVAHAVTTRLEQDEDVAEVVVHVNPAPLTLVKGGDPP